MHLPLTAKMDAVQAIPASTAESATRDVTSMANGFFANADQEQRGHFVKKVRKLTISVPFWNHQSQKTQTFK